ncbi:FAD-dependent oxidoreductase [Glaciimonas immobilis]
MLGVDRINGRFIRTALVHRNFFKRTFTEPVPAMKETFFAKKNIDTYHGRAHFYGSHLVEVGGEVLTGRFILIGVGAVPMRLGILGEEHLVTSTDFAQSTAKENRFSWWRLHRRRLCSHCGSSRCTSNCDPEGEAHADAVRSRPCQLAHGKFYQTGIDVRIRTRVTAIEKSNDGLAIRASLNDREEMFNADLMVYVAGRVPDLEPLDLAVAGVVIEKGHLTLKEFLQGVSNPAIYAVGDAASSGPPLTPVVSHDAKVVAANMLNGNYQKLDYLGVPSVAFTIPPIASVGLSEKQAHENGLKFRMRSENAADWYTARRVAESAYGFKVLVEEGTDRILGAHLIGPHVEEVINIFALSIRKGLTAEDLKTTMFAYPTGASDIASMI